MALRSCHVSVTDLNGVRHSAEVTASSLFEAIALGLVVIRDHHWGGEIPDGLNTVEVSVIEVPVTHTVRVRDFNSWLNRNGGSPRDTIQRGHIRRIMGIAGTRIPSRGLI